MYSNEGACSEEYGLSFYRGQGALAREITVHVQVQYITHQSGDASKLVTTLKVDLNFDAPSTFPSSTCLAAICNRDLSLATNVSSLSNALIWLLARSLVAMSVTSAKFCHSSSLSAS